MSPTSFSARDLSDMKQDSRLFLDRVCLVAWVAWRDGLRSRDWGVKTGGEK